MKIAAALTAALDLHGAIETLSKTLHSIALAEINLNLLLLSYYIY